MSTLYLIRHGQASFGALDYDVLSSVGARQSRALAAYWAERGIRFDAIYVGPRSRHRETARHLVNEARDRGADFPDPIERAELDEYPAFELVKHWTPRLQGEDPEIAAMLAEPENGKGYQQAFEALIGKWVRGELDTGDLETYADFVERVDSGMKQIMEREGRGKRIAVVTSGGPISATLRSSLGLADDMMLRVAWVIANCSVSEFRYRDAESIAMITFNNTPHLEDPELLTYR